MTILKRQYSLTETKNKLEISNNHNILDAYIEDDTLIIESQTNFRSHEKDGLVSVKIKGIIVRKKAKVINKLVRQNRDRWSLLRKKLNEAGLKEALSLMEQIENESRTRKIIKR